MSFHAATLSTARARLRDRFGRSVRTDRYRYTEWDEGREGVEFYDHQTDTNEWTNLAGRAEVSMIQRDLQQLLREGIGNNRPAVT